MAVSKLLLCLCAAAFASLGACSARERKMVGTYELKRGDFAVNVTNFGATILNVVVPDSRGKLEDVVLGFDKLNPYVVHPPYVNKTYYFGVLVGRVANRIAKSRFVLDGKAYHLFPNNGKNSLHGGHRGFGQNIWTIKERTNCSIALFYHSFDGEQGFPGDLDVTVTYSLSGDYELTTDMSAKALNKATPVNLAQHSYWNLGREGSGTILQNFVKIFGSHITPVDKELIPTGDIAPVADTPYDFRVSMQVGSRLAKVPGGYDINYVLDSPTDGNGMRKAATVEDRRSGRKMELMTNQPGLQFYTGGQLDNVEGKHGHVYPQYGAICLETQGFPDSVNHPNFPSQIVKPGEVYKHTMVHRFSF